MHDESFESFKNIVTQRRSIRVYENTQIPDHTIRACLELAQLAPNSSNLQTCQFYWVKDSKIKQKLDAACMDQPAAKTAPTLLVCVGRTKLWKKHAKAMHALLKQQNAPASALDYYTRLVPFIYTQGPLSILGILKSFLFFIMGFTRAVPREPTSHAGNRLWIAKSAALACQNLMLALTAAGYDSCPMEGFDEVRVKKALKLPKDAFVVMIISAGKKTPQGIYGPRIRFDFNEFVKEI